MGGNHLLILVAAVANVPTRPAAEVVVRHPVVVLGEVADLSGLAPALRGRGALIPVARVPQGRSDISVTGAEIIARVRAHMPVLAGLALPARLAIHYAPDPAVHDQTSHNAMCLQARSDIAPGAVLQSEDFAEKACSGPTMNRAFRFDPGRRAVVASQTIPAGAFITRYRDYGRTAAYAGQSLSLISTVGPVTVSREVSALQSASADDRLFVRTADGEVLSVQFRNMR